MARDSLVCIVDDDDSLRQSLRSLLASVGLPTAAFSSAEELLDSAEVADAGCLLLDVHMPGMSGLELQRALLARDAKVPVVFLSASSDAAVRERALRDGAFDYLTKPFDEDTLIEVVRAALTPP